MKILQTTVTMIIVFLLLTTAIPRPVHAQDEIKLADAYPIIQKGDYDKAISFLRKYNSQYKDRVDGILLLGQLYLSKGYFTAMDYAEAVFREGLLREPENTMLLQYLADLNRKKGMIEHAQYYLKRSITVDPNNPEALEQLMITYILREDGQGLREILEKVHGWSAAHQHPSKQKQDYNAADNVPHLVPRARRSGRIRTSIWHTHYFYVAKSF